VRPRLAAAAMAIAGMAAVTAITLLVLEVILMQENKAIEFHLY
jgi:hypothetical protein